MYYYFGEEIGFDILELLPLFGDDIRSQVQITDSLCEFLAYENKDWLSRDIESVLLQQALVWCKSSRLEIRRNTIQMLFRLLGTQNNKVIANQLINSMDTDNVYIKNTILRLLLNDGKLGISTRNYLLQKAEVDTHFVVREVYKEVKEEIDAKDIKGKF